MNSKLYLYSFLAQFRLLKKSYTAKILLVAFLGTHVPLLTLIVSFVTSNSYSWEMTVQVLLTALVATLVGTVATLYTLRYLLAPVIATSAALQEYLQGQEYFFCHFRLMLLAVMKIRLEINRYSICSGAARLK